MAISKNQKTRMVQDLVAELKNSKSVAFAYNKGISVAEQKELRLALQEVQGRLIVIKKTLFKIAIKEAGLPEVPTENLTGPIMVAFAHEDEIANFQQIFEFSKKHPTIKLTGGILAGENLTEQAALQLANLPSLAALQGQFVGLLAAPLRSFVQILQAVPTSFVRALAEIQKKSA